MMECWHTSRASKLTYIVISMGKVLLGVVPHLQALVVTDEAVPVMTEAELLVGAACKEKRTGGERTSYGIKT